MSDLRSSQRILVTGAAGFIGSHVSDALLHRGDQVIGYDNFDDFYDPEVKRRNIAWASAQPGFELVEGDIRDAARLDLVLEAFRPDVIVHLAARAGVRPSIVDPVLYDSVNVLGTSTLLEAVRRHGIPHVVLASSSSVYGATSVAPFREDETADRPSSPYAATKRALELAAYSHHHLYGTSTTCLRFFTVYGPRQRPEMAIHKFAKLIDSGQPVPMLGDGASRRDYTFVDDVVQGVLASVDRPRGYRIYNLGTTDTTSLRDLISMISRRVGREAVIDEQSALDGDVPLTHADISLAAQELDYAPTTAVADGLDEFVAWFQEMKTSRVITLPRHAVPTPSRMSAERQDSDVISA